MTPGFTTHESSCGRKQKKTLNTPVSPWGISNTYSGLQMTLRPEISKRGRPNAPHCPSLAGSSQRDLDAPIPKELSLPCLKAGMLGG